ncbi:multiple epidermal growth factor-like domains protein 10 [Lampetra planeri]
MGMGVEGFGALVPLVPVGLPPSPALAPSAGAGGPPEEAAGGESLGAVVGVVRRRLRGLARGGRREPGAGAAAAAASFSAGAARSVASECAHAEHPVQCGCHSLYVNPGYQTLSQGHSAQGIANNNLELRCTGRPNNARVPAMKNLEREKLAARCAEGSATLPVLWKRSTNPYQLGASGVERAYNTCKSHKEYSKGSRGSSGSVGSESPYATIRETPALPASPAPARSPPPPAGGGPVSPPRGSEAAGYVEMKAPGGPGGPGGPRESTYAEIVCSPAHGLAGHAATGSTRNVYEMGEG